MAAWLTPTWCLRCRLVALTDKSGEGKYSRPLEVLTLRNLPKLTDKGMTTLLGSPAVRKLREFRLAGTRAVSNMGLIGMANISASVTHLETKRRLAGTGALPGVAALPSSSWACMYAHSSLRIPRLNANLPPHTGQPSLRPRRASST